MHEPNKQQDLEDQLMELALSDATIQKDYRTDLSWEFGGSQFVSCFKFAARVAGDKIIFAQAMFTKQWVEQSSWKLNASFWEKGSNMKNLQDYLDCGASVSLARCLTR